MDDKRPCPVGDCCTRRITGDKLMCLEHWRMVPPTIQREVNATWRNYRRDPQAYLVARRNAIDAAVKHDPNMQGSLL